MSSENNDNASLDNLQSENVSQENMTMDINETDNLPTKEEITQVPPSTQQKIDITKIVSTNLGLLVNLKRIVDVCVSRGAFKKPINERIIIGITNKITKDKSL